MKGPGRNIVGTDRSPFMVGDLDAGGTKPYRARKGVPRVPFRLALAGPDFRGGGDFAKRIRRRQDPERDQACAPPFLHRLVAFGDFTSSGSEQHDPAPSPKGILR